MSDSVQPGPHTPTILIVESDTTTGTVLSQLLELTGYHVTMATATDTALHLLRTGRPALVLLDVALAACGAHTVAQEVQRLYGAGVPCIVTTTNLAASFSLCGLIVAGIIEKPFHIKDVLFLVRENLAQAW
jgi:DNA-binding response OmpR family regulator